MNQLKQINNLTKPQSFFKVYEAHFTLKLPTEMKLLARTKLNSERFSNDTAVEQNIHQFRQNYIVVRFQSFRLIFKHKNG